MNLQSAVKFNAGYDDQMASKLKRHMNLTQNLANVVQFLTN